MAFGCGISRGAWARLPKAVAIVIVASVCVADTAALAKTPGETYCHNESCRRVRTLRETETLIGQQLTLKASYYDHCQRDRFNPCRLTSSGEHFRADEPDNAASPDLPDGTLLLLFNPATQKAAVVRINNAGPYHSDRQLDVSRATAEVLGFHERGVAMLEALVLRAPQPSEAQYRRQRRYEPTAGFIGTFASLAAAQASLAHSSLSQVAPRETPVQEKAARDDRLTMAIALIPMPVMPTAPPMIETHAVAASFDDARMTSSIVAGLPPLSTRILFGLTPRFATVALHHPGGNEIADTASKSLDEPAMSNAVLDVSVGWPFRLSIADAVAAARPCAAERARPLALSAIAAMVEKWRYDTLLQKVTELAVERARPIGATAMTGMGASH